jgi:hypothetical protein
MFLTVPGVVTLHGSGPLMTAQDQFPGIGIRTGAGQPVLISWLKTR